MAEYIEREALIKRLSASPPLTLSKNATAVIFNGVLDLVEKQPTADVVEVRHGEWIEADNTRKGQKFVCSVCKQISYYPQPTRNKNWAKHCGYSHCPNCLAKMDGKGEGE